MSRAANTQRAYASDVRDFAAWCAARGRPACPAAPADVAAYLRERAEVLAPATVARRLAAIVAAHHRLGFESPRDDPDVRHALASIEWHHRTRRRPTRPLDAESLARLSLCLPATVTGTRDRALLLLGYGAALRRTELVALDVPDVVVDDDDVLRITSSRGRVAIPPGSRPHLCARARVGPRGPRSSGTTTAPRSGPSTGTATWARPGCRIAPSPSWCDARGGRRARRRRLLRSVATSRHDPLGCGGGRVRTSASCDHTGHRTRRLVRAYRDS